MSLQVRRAGRVVFEHYCGHAKPGQLFTPDTICRFYSTTKPMVAVVVLRLIEQGLIALDDPIDKHIPEWHDSMVRVQSGKLLDSSCAAHTPITVRHLLVSHPSAGMCAVLSKDCAASCTAACTASCTASCAAACTASCAASCTASCAGINPPNSTPPNSKLLTSPCEVPDPHSVCRFWSDPYFWPHLWILQTRSLGNVRRSQPGSARRHVQRARTLDAVLQLSNTVDQETDSGAATAR